MEKKRGNGLGYIWAVAAGSNASMAAVIAKATSSSGFDRRFQLLGYAGVVLLNVTMWSCYVSSLKALTSLQATVVNFATNFLVSGLTGLFLFKESLNFQRAVHITPSMANELIQILKTEGVEFVVSPYEADAQLAYLSRLEPEKGGIVAVMS